MEHKLVQYEDMLKKKESEHRAHIHNLERKILQDKVCFFVTILIYIIYSTFET